jgi:hypothetical protein
LGRFLLDSGKTKDAVQPLETGAKLAPENPTIHFTLMRRASLPCRKVHPRKLTRTPKRCGRMRRERRRKLIRSWPFILALHRSTVFVPNPQFRAL